MATAAQTLAQFAADLKFEQIPDDVITRGRDCIIDTIAAASYGAQFPWSRLVIDYAQRYGAAFTYTTAFNYPSATLFGVELESRPGAPGARAYEAFLKCLELGVLVRYTGDILAFSPPLIISEAEIDQLFDTVKQALQSIQ